MSAIKCSDLKPDPNLKRILLGIEDYILAHQAVDTFDEIMKLMVAKAYDERVNLDMFPGMPLKHPTRLVKFRTYEEEEETELRIRDLFHRATSKWSGLFQSDTDLDLKPRVLHYSVTRLQGVTLSHSGLDSLGEAFEALINPRIKGEKGQFFTPPQVVRMAVTMTDPRIDDRILDPACGSGAFLVETVRKIIGDESIQDKEKKIARFVKDNVYGIDFDPRLVKIARAYMIIFGSGENNIHLLDALDIENWGEGDKDTLRDFDVIITNPPFAGRIDDDRILRNYKLSEQSYSKKGFPRKTTREILFLERSIQMLKEGGKLGIVLPHGITNNQSLQHVREYLLNNGQILAVVSFDENMFRPYTSAKTCFLLFKRLRDVKTNYPIFFAISEKSGKNSKGDYVFTKKAKVDQTRITVDGVEHSVDSDTHEIAIAFRRFRGG